MVAIMTAQQWETEWRQLEHKPQLGVIISIFVSGFLNRAVRS